MPETQHTAAAYAAVHGSPGERARLAGVIVAIWPLLLAALIGGYLVRAALPVPALTSPVAGALILILAIGFAITAGLMHKRLAAFLRGARGEEWVAHELAFLPTGYHVFHGLASRGQTMIPQGGADYDHVVVGPTGVFVVETKNWQDEITIDGGQILYDGCEPTRPPVDQVKKAAHSLEKALADRAGNAVTVHPIVCFAGNSFKLPAQGVMGAIACNARDVVSVLTGAFETPLDATTIHHLVDALKSPGRNG